MDLKPEIWISSISHLEDVGAIVKDVPLRTKLFGFYDMPDNFPFMKLNRIRKSPLVYFSKGEINFEHDKLRYNAIKRGSYLLNSFHNLNEDLSFIINRSNIKSIEWYPYGIASVRKIRENWIRITCNEDILGGDFLICANGISNNRILFEMLKQFKEGQAVSESLIDFSGSIMPFLGYIGIVLFFATLIIFIAYDNLIGDMGDRMALIIIFILFGISPILFITSQIWCSTKISENFKIYYHWKLLGKIFKWTLILFILICVIRIFYHF